MICAYCGENQADHRDKDGRPECAPCAGLQVDPVEALAFGIDEATFQTMTVQ
jgi:hypothetical protein